MASDPATISADIIVEQAPPSGRKSSRIKRKLGGTFDVLTDDTAVNTLPKKPRVAPPSKKKATKKREVDPKALSGTIFIRSLPHGFYELQLRDYFSQFGKVHDVRVLRQRKTGNAKGLAWVRFAKEAVATAAAESMNNYLMFNKLVKCHHLTNEQVPPEVFKLKYVIPFERCKLRTRRFNKAKSPEAETRATKQLLYRLRKRNAKLSAMGVDYELPLPQLPAELPADVGRRRHSLKKERAKRKLTREQARLAKRSKSKTSATVDPTESGGEVKSEPEIDRDSDSNSTSPVKSVNTTMLSSSSRYFSMCPADFPDEADENVKDVHAESDAFVTPQATPKKKVKRKSAKTDSTRRSKRVRMIK